MKGDEKNDLAGTFIGEGILPDLLPGRQVPESPLPSYLPSEVGR